MERFWKKVDRREPHECWEWRAARNPHGYGVIGHGPHHTVLAHRLSWELHAGPIPPGMSVCHHCDNPGCVNPAHLFLGTHTDNMRDSAAKGRNGSTRHPRRGELNARTSLTPGDVTVIRALHLWSGFSLREIGAEYGLTKHAIHRIVKRKNWAHVPFGGYGC